MTELYPLCIDGGLNLANSVFDGIEIYSQIEGDAGKLRIRDAVNRLIKELPQISENCKMLQKIMEAYPDSIPGRTIAGIIAAQRWEKLTDPESAIAELQQWQTEVC